ncbi:MAG TPA: Asp-tRNA(Asn)/Glu-tRNA(Gln) amidotransferase subunit GatB [Nitrososphaeraceae archaeon]|nr:Asp-tRNA(Asn)/Glu-tRNA(Gln) amidotransferase subunit GatB [Nitrososphaeraceae archaeon]
MALPVKIGLEIHCQLTQLNTKLFCGCYSNYREKEVNSNICPVCIGLPGSLPILNKKAVEFAIMISKALNCKIPEITVFSRKNYFYPDLPKNFQITQYDSAETNTSIGKEGVIKYGENNNTARIRRIQLEEDPGRLVYESGRMQALIDYNRAGVALVEIVTEPDFNNPKDVRIFLNKMTSILEHLTVCNTNLEGSLRCDANISIGNGKKVEIKNVGSFSDIEKALTYEITRQQTMNLHDIEIKAETRHWDDKRKITKQARSKEEEEDYRYFPEPDIPKILLEDTHVSLIKMPELPDERKSRFIDNYKLSAHVAQVLIDNKELADLFESAIKIYHSPKSISNWIVSDILAFIEYDESGKKTITEETKIGPKHIAEIAKLVDENTINRSTAKSIISKIIKSGELPSEIMKKEKQQVTIINDKEILLESIDKIFEEERKAVLDAKQNPTAINFLLGKIMKFTKGRADPKMTTVLLKEKLNEIK